MIFLDWQVPFRLIEVEFQFADSGNFHHFRQPISSIFMRTNILIFRITGGLYFVSIV